MAIYHPDIRLSDDDKELLHLLADLILSSSDDRIGSNFPKDLAILGDSEARRLIILLENFISSKKFIEASYLIEHVFNRREDDSALRDIYLTWKKRHGRSRALATAQWQGFLARLGLRSMTGVEHPWHRQPIKSMSFEHFMRMEKILSAASGVHPRVQRLILSFVEKQEPYIQSLRNGQANMANNQIVDTPKRLLSTLNADGFSKISVNALPTQQIIGIAVIVMDFSTLFTTRDWDVSGFFSTVAGAAPAVVLSSD